MTATTRATMRELMLCEVEQLNAKWACSDDTGRSSNALCGLERTHAKSGVLDRTTRRVLSR